MSDSKTRLIGRDKERQQMSMCLDLGRHVLLEGPVGVGKTLLAATVAHERSLEVIRIDGDQRFTEHKMTGWFDPPVVLHKGYTPEAFIAGPLVQAMQKGGVLFLNELNRLPEGVQNVLLSALDEGRLQLPRIGEVRAAKGFAVVATQNPREFVATTRLSEALLDRFELIVLDYPSSSEETEIVVQALSSSNLQLSEQALGAVVRLVRSTRNHEFIRRGASIRAAIAVSQLLAIGEISENRFVDVAQMALSTRIEIEANKSEILNPAKNAALLIEMLAREAWVGKKKTQN